MATQQEDRYQTVKEFQEAIRDYQSHSESLVLTAHAEPEPAEGPRVANDYPLFARALYGFQESLTLWDAQPPRPVAARPKRSATTPSCALDKGDFDLAASLLDTSHAEHQALLAQIDAARTRARRAAAPAAAGEDGGRRRSLRGIIATIIDRLHLLSAPNATKPSWHATNRGAVHRKLAEAERSRKPITQTAEAGNSARKQANEQAEKEARQAAHEVAAAKSQAGTQQAETTRRSP